MPTEIVRLRAPLGDQESLLSYLSGHAYFEQTGLQSYRVLRHNEGEEVVLVLDWEAPESGPAAISSPVGQAFVEGLMPLLSGPPELGYYELALERLRR